MEFYKIRKGEDYSPEDAAKATLNLFKKHYSTLTQKQWCILKKQIKNGLKNIIKKELPESEETAPKKSIKTTPE